jgi:uncharacterized protein involved in exopolysaccharide biosynthesis
MAAVQDEIITLGDISEIARRVRWPTLVGLVIGALLALGASFLIRPVYQARVTVLPASNMDKGALGDLPAQFGGLAALAGIDLGSNEGKTRSIELLKSRSLVERFIRTNDLMPVLFGDQLKDADPPTLSDGIRTFETDVRRVSVDRRTGVVTVSMDWENPQLAQKWANDFVRMANEELRARAIRDAQATLNYLNQQTARTSVVGVRESLFRLMEAQLKNEALARVREDYAFQVVDPAFLPDDEDIVRPQRLVLALVGGLIGAALAGFIGYARVRKRRP